MSINTNNEVIAETEEYQAASRATVSLKRNVKIPPCSCTVVDIDFNSTEEVKVEVIPDELWLSANPNICTYPMTADLKDRKPDTVTPFIIVNFSHHEYLHLPKDHVRAFAEKDCNESDIFEIYNMEEMEKENTKDRSELFKNPFMTKQDNFLKSPAEAPSHRKVLLEDFSQKGFEQLCDRYDDIISKTVMTLARPC